MREASCRLRESPSLELRISTLPGKDTYGGIAAIEHAKDAFADGLSVADIQLLEEAEYAYEVVGGAGSVILQPTELFSPSGSLGRVGRLRTGRSTGTVVISAIDAEGDPGAGVVEVRSRKLHYLSEYRWMLQRIASEAAEAVQSQFAASSLTAFKPGDVGDVETLYQRFAFLQALIGSSEFQSALQTIASRPHEEYEPVETSIDPGRGIGGSSALVREMLRPGPRQPSGLGSAMLSLPVSVRSSEHLPTFDTIPNRFVRHAIVRWRDLAIEVHDACLARTGPAAARGVAEAGAMVHQLEQILAAPVMRRLSRLRTFPSSNTVLQRRAGYRDVFRAYLQAEAAALVDWEGGLDAFAAGQRDVATLYEYWVFLELARIISEIPGFSLDRRELFRKSADKLSLTLFRGSSAVLKGSGARLGTTVELDLWFNRQFAGGSTWTEPMRPDCSLRIRASGERGGDRTRWIHFDAKYRIDNYKQVFVNSDPEATSASGPLAQDLLKMHAYRDAIRRTSGAYVLYPGGDEPPVTHQEFHEILPGLGAFVFRPGPDGRAIASGALALRGFLEDAIDHLASAGTDEHRGGFWKDLTYTERVGRRTRDAAWSARPPADTSVLLGYVRSSDHLRWIQRLGLYNLRADSNRAGAIDLASPELSADVVVLYGNDGDEIVVYESLAAFTVVRSTELAALGYPREPGGALYCGLRLGRQLSIPAGLSAAVVRETARLADPAAPEGAPRVVSLSTLLEYSSQH